MKVLILSDSHGFTSLLENILKKERGCDAVIHLGDGGADMFTMREYTAAKPCYQVKGNCDISAYDFPLRLISYFGEIKFFACHGHTHNVKENLLSLFYAAKEQSCTLVLYGHTHIQRTDEYDTITAFNPGSVSNGCYGILEVNGKSFTVSEHRL